MSAKTLNPVSCRLESDVHARLQALAQQKQRSVSWLMKEAINDYLHAEEEKAQMIQECQEAWSQYEASGRKHITAREAIEWMKTWGTDNELPAPKCHK